MEQMTFPYATGGKHLPLRPHVSALPIAEQPTCRLQHSGAGALSVAELLAALIQTPDALILSQELLVRFGYRGLLNASVSELCALHGIGPARAAQIKAALELGKRLLVTSPEEKPQIRSPADAANLLMPEMGSLEQEQLRVVLLDTRNRVIAIRTVYVGNLNTTVVRVGEIFHQAIKASAAAIIIVHNHPSGDPSPSPQDIAVTAQIVQAGQMLNIEVLDHLIIGNSHHFVSLKERGLGFA